MATTAQLTTIISNRLVKKVTDELVWANVASAVSQMSTAEKADVVAAIKVNDASELGKLIFRAVRNYVEVQADSEAAEMMTDNTLTFTELDRILG